MTTSAIPRSAIRTQDDDLAQPSRLLLSRSHAFALVRNGASDAEISAAISSELATALDAALAGIARELVTVDMLSDQQQEKFRAEIAAFVALTGGGWMPEQRAEFIHQAAIDLGDIPARLLAPAIREARRRVWEPKRFVSWVHEIVAADVAKLRAEADMLRRLGSVMNGNGAA